MKFIQRVGVVLVALALIWVSAAGAKVVASDGQAGRAKVLIIGDSVFDLMVTGPLP